MTPKMSAESEEVDELFNCLGHARRRRIVEVVAAESTPVAVDHVMDVISVEFDTSRGPRSSGSSNNTAISLFHHHLPKLREGEILDVDKDSGLVEKGDQFERAVEHLEMV